jgi:hypothetical protein
MGARWLARTSLGTGELVTIEARTIAIAIHLRLRAGGPVPARLPCFAAAPRGARFLGLVAGEALIVERRLRRATYSRCPACRVAGVLAEWHVASQLTMARARILECRACERFVWTRPANRARASGVLDDYVELLLDGASPRGVAQALLEDTLARVETCVPSELPAVLEELARVATGLAAHAIPVLHPDGSS